MVLLPPGQDGASEAKVVKVGALAVADRVAVNIPGRPFEVAVAGVVKLLSWVSAVLVCASPSCDVAALFPLVVSPELCAPSGHPPPGLQGSIEQQPRKPFAQL